MKKCLIIGGGASGMFTAISLAGPDREIHIYEKNEKLGKKLFITGKGRCNVTNNSDPETFLKNIVSNSRFLYSSAYSFTSADMISHLEKAGVSLKTERGDRVFPVSDHSSDIIRALEDELHQKHVFIHKNTKVKEICKEDGKVTGIVLSSGAFVAADAVVVATGGKSYQTTGSDGDGYRFAENMGLTVTRLVPALVPLNCKELYVPRLQGLSLKNVTLTIQGKKKPVYEGFGEMMFTHFGITGPLVLSASSVISRELEQGPLSAFINLKPALSGEQIDARLLREFEENKNKQFQNAIHSMFPAKLIPILVELSRIAPEKTVNSISRKERADFVSLITHFPITITGKRGFAEAIITQGGVAVKQINPKTMEAKTISGLYFVGEVLDVDAFTGGFNLQIAWSTAYLAARSIASKMDESAVSDEIKISERK